VAESQALVSGAPRTAQIARAIFNSASIAAGMADPALAIEVCRSLGEIEGDYTLVARDALMAGTARAETARRDGRSETPPAAASSLRRMPAKFPGRCGHCGGHIQVGALIAYDPEAKRAFHEGCAK
jgi:hypothetical protein